MSTKEELEEAHAVLDLAGLERTEAIYSFDDSFLFGLYKTAVEGVYVTATSEDIRKDVYTAFYVSNDRVVVSAKITQELFRQRAKEPRTDKSLRTAQAIVQLLPSEKVLKDE